MIQQREGEQWSDRHSTSMGRVPSDWARLILKLRWIGLEEEAERLELAVSTLPPGERGSVSFGPFSTD